MNLAASYLANRKELCEVAAKERFLKWGGQGLLARMHYFGPGRPPRGKGMSPSVDYLPVLTRKL